MQHCLELILTYLMCYTVSSDTLVSYNSPTDKPIEQILPKAIIFGKQFVVTSSIMSGSKDTCCPLSLRFYSADVDILQGVERPGSVYSIMQK